MQLKKWIIPIILFLLPFQTRYVAARFGLSSNGSEFGTMSLYAVELLMLLTFIIRGGVKVRSDYRTFIWLTLGILAIAALSLVLSIDPAVSASQLMHLGFAMMLFLLLLDERTDIRLSLGAFCVGLIIPSVFGIIQVLMGGFPPSSMLGIATRSASMLGDSVFFFGDHRILRAYGTFPHPNIFGGYLAIGMIAATWLQRKKFRNLVTEKMGTWLPLFFAGALLLTGSRSAMFGLILAAIVSFVVLKLKSMNLARTLVVPVAFLFIGGVLALSFGTNLGSLRIGSEAESYAISERAQQYADYPEVIGQHWLIGSGLGSYSLAYEQARPTYEWWQYQPIHNTILLIIAEIGLIGALIVLSWSSVIDKLNFARFPNKDAVAAFAMGNVVLVILFFDHYLWSLWPGLALIAIVMAMTVRMGEE
ncbi:MAG: O-antigen ligase family protein [bacterium]|nr:O-antigen ligase family protein [bacterium]